MTTFSQSLPAAFIWRRLHSLTGLWLVLFLLEHLFTNSQAALLWGTQEKGFIRLVNALHNLPYLEVIEMTLLGVPILLHLIWGIQYLLTCRFNVLRSDGTTPSLQYGRNHAYTWQRITSWILLIGLVGHIIKFRFLEYPLSLDLQKKTEFFVRISQDPSLELLSRKLGVTLYNYKAVQQEEQRLVNLKRALNRPIGAFEKEQLLRQIDWIETLTKRSLRDQTELIAVSDQFGTATLLSVRSTFLNPIYAIAYTAFVLAACFHACNGFWTFLITWGVVLRMAAQKAMIRVSTFLMILLVCLGLAAIWGAYFAPKPKVLEGRS